MGADTLFTAEAIEAIKKLAPDPLVSVHELPQDALPPGLVVEKANIAVVYTGDGKVEIRSLQPLVDDLRGKPSLRKGTATVTTLASFIALVQRHATADTAIFVDADWRKPSLTAVIDYHAPRGPLDPEEAGTREKSAAGDDPGARFGKHRIAYPFPLSESWKRWVASNGKQMLQEQFASFLEDHIAELSSPLPQEEAEARDRFKTTVGAPNVILSLSRELEVTVGAKIKSKKRLDNGETSLVFETENSATRSGGEAVDVPGMFIVNVPVFYGGDPVRVLARLRYRPAAENGVVWFYTLHRPDETVDAAVLDAVAEGERALDLPFYYGAPEIG